jgi:hypothetical protein
MIKIFPCLYNNSNDWKHGYYFIGRVIARVELLEKCGFDPVSVVVSYEFFDIINSELSLGLSSEHESYISTPYEANEQVLWSFSRWTLHGGEGQ